MSGDDFGTGANRNLTGRAGVGKVREREDYRRKLPRTTVVAVVRPTTRWLYVHGQTPGGWRIVVSSGVETEGVVSETRLLEQALQGLLSPVAVGQAPTRPALKQEAASGHGVLEAAPRSRQKKDKKGG